MNLLSVKVRQPLACRYIEGDSKEMASEDLRPDIAQAVARMRSKVGARRELHKLPEHLWEGETCEMVLKGTYGGGNGILALTNQRIMFLKEGIINSKSEDFPLKNVSSIQFKKGTLFGSITIFASGNKAEIGNLDKVNGQDFVDEVRQRISAVASSPVNAPPAPTAPDPLDQLKKLAELRDAGVLTPEEFAVQKTKILGN